MTNSLQKGELEERIVRGYAGIEDLDRKATELTCREKSNVAELLG